MSLAQMEDISFEIKKIPFNISNAIHDVILSMEAAVTDKHIQLTCSIEPDVMIKSDPERIKQVIAILFENAIKYTNENGKIDLSLMKSKRHIVFSIKNTGKGIGKQDLPSQISIDTPIIQRVA